MPQHVWMNSHYYVTSDDHYLPVAPRSEHRIAVYPWAKQAVELAWLRKQPDPRSRAEADRLGARLTEHWLKEAEEMRRAGRLKAAIGGYREALLLAPSPTTRKRMQEVITRQTELDDLHTALEQAAPRSPVEAIELAKRILKLDPDDARAHGELGMLYVVTGRRAEAIPHLKAVARCDPTNSSGVTGLAWRAHLEGRQEEAAGLCAEADRIEPGHPMTHFIWGLALSKQGRWGEAETHFRRTLKLTPTHGGANQGLSEALRHQGQAGEAVRFARLAVRWSERKHAELLLTLAEAYAAAGRLPDARKAFNQALALAEANNPPLAPVIRKRLGELP
jgi:tetratricopeptide (TPR) repeat protein